MSRISNSPVNVYVIGFQTPDEHLRQSLDAFPDMRIHSSPAVLADQDSRWGSYRAKPHIGPGAAGCMLAHLDALSAVAAHEGSVPERPAMILESDARLTGYGEKWLPLVVADCENSNTNFIQLGSNRTVLTAPRHTRSRVEFVRTWLETQILTYGRPKLTQALTSISHAYLVKPSFARELLSINMGFQLPIDDWYRALALNPRNRMFRVRQDVFEQEKGPSLIESIGR